MEWIVSVKETTLSAAIIADEENDDNDPISRSENLYETAV